MATMPKDLSRSQAGTAPMVGGFPLPVAAHYTGLKPGTLRLYCRLGWVRPTRFGRRLVFRVEELDRLLREGTPSRPKTDAEER